MENQPDMPSLCQTNTRIKHCVMGCGAVTQERRVEMPSFNGRKLHCWESDWADEFCPGCAEKRRQEANERELQRAREVNRKYLSEMLGGPRPLEEYTLASAAGNFELTKMEALTAARNFVPRAENLFLYGPAGTGKTHLAVAIAQDQCSRGRSVAFYTPGSLMREFRRRLDPDKEERFIKHLSLIEVLVIDDLGIGKGSEYAMEKFQEIIDGRITNYRNGLVITSNLSLNGIAEVYKDRIPDRLNGMCRKIKIDGPSFRVHK